MIERKNAQTTNPKVLVDFLLFHSINRGSQEMSPTYIIEENQNRKNREEEK